MLERNKIMSRWSILVHNKKLWTFLFCWELEQNKNEFLFWLQCLRIFRIASGYLLHSLIFPHSLRIFKDFGTQITNTAVFTKIFIFQKWVPFPILSINRMLISQLKWFLDVKFMFPPQFNVLIFIIILVSFVYRELVCLVTYQFFNLLWTIICIYFYFLIIELESFTWVQVIRSFFSCVL